MSTSSSDQNWLTVLSKYIAQTRPCFSVTESEDDMSKIHDVEDVVQANYQAKARHIDTMRESIRSLSRQAELTKSTSSRPATAPNAQQHEAKLIALDSQKFALGKMIAELEEGIARAENEAGGCRKKVDRAEGMGAWDDEVDFDVLRLKMTRELGFLPLDDGGRITKIIARSDSRSTANTVDISSNKNAFEVTNRLWELAA